MRPLQNTWLKLHLNDAVLHILDHLFKLVNFSRGLDSLLSQLCDLALHSVLSLQECVHILFLDRESIVVLPKLVDLVVNLALNVNLAIGGAAIPAESDCLGALLALQLVVVQVEGRVIEIHGRKGGVQGLSMVGSARGIEDDWQMLQHSGLDLHDVIRMDPKLERLAVESSLVRHACEGRGSDGGAKRKGLASERMVQLGKTHDERVKVDVVKRPRLELDHKHRSEPVGHVFLWSGFSGHGVR